MFLAAPDKKSVTILMIWRGYAARIELRAHHMMLIRHRQMTVMMEVYWNSG
jgi:hypothetical protein